MPAARPYAPLTLARKPRVCSNCNGMVRATAARPSIMVPIRRRFPPPMQTEKQYLLKSSPTAKSPVWRIHPRVWCWTSVCPGSTLCWISARSCKCKHKQHHVSCAELVVASVSLSNSSHSEVSDMGFGQGLSGLNAASQSLDVIGNNIANSGTVGFKAADVSFADVFASSRVGLGTQVAGINQRFAIGTVKDTGNQFDIAIDGEKGFFRVLDTNGAVLYTRNGQFHANKDNEIVNAQGHRLTGYAVGEGNPTPIKVPTGNIEPQATDRIELKTNLDANAEVIDTTVAFDPTDGDTFTHSQPVDVYDSLGNAHQLVQYFVKRGESGGNSQWEVYYTL